MSPRPSNIVSSIVQTVTACLFVASMSAACNSEESTRFSLQNEYIRFSTSDVTISAHGAGATKINASSAGTLPFICPNIGFVQQRLDYHVIRVKSYVNELSFDIENREGIKCSESLATGFSISDLPSGLLDVYEKCNTQSSDRYFTACPENYEIVDSCAETSSIVACAKISEGTHRLVASSQILDSVTCYFSETGGRDQSQSINESCVLCDSFKEHPVIAAYRGDKVSTDSCCPVLSKATVNFCLKPCGCRKNLLRIEAKESYGENRSLKIGVFSNNENTPGKLKAILDSMANRNVDIIVNLGNLTSDGTAKQITKLSQSIHASTRTGDGEDCVVSGDTTCCRVGSRKHKDFCVDLIARTPFINGVGFLESKSSNVPLLLSEFNALNFSAYIGHVQLILLDSADAVLPQAQKQWLESQLPVQKDKHESCNIPKIDLPEFERWPSLAACKLSGFESCTHCIREEAVCVAPPESESDPNKGHLNCVCLPATSKYCKNGKVCAQEDGTDSECVCTRDTDCNRGAYCSDGYCKEPVRLVFTYTPLFDVIGMRGQSFRSRKESTQLLSLFAQSKVSHVFSGSVLSYEKFKKAGVNLILTGGGGAKMEAFAPKSHHWVLVEIPDAYTKPVAENIKVTPVEI